jgi:hypothetical protein
MLDLRCDSARAAQYRDETVARLIRIAICDRRRCFAPFRDFLGKRPINRAGNSLGAFLKNSQTQSDEQMSREPGHASGRRLS